MKKLFYILTFTFMLNVTVFATTPSNWARNEVNTAIEQNLVPTELQNNYTENISRKDFCKLCTSVMKAWDEDFVVSSGSISFEDTEDLDILACANIDIVNGTGNNKFSPDKPITRQEAARMLYNTLKIATPTINNNHIEENKANFCCFPHVFSDNKNIRGWARDEINHLYRLGVMFGTADNSFMPDNYYTKEQAICTFLRLYNAYKNPEENTLPEEDIIYTYSRGNYNPNTIIIDYHLFTNDFYNMTKEEKELCILENYSTQIIGSNLNKYSPVEKGFIPSEYKYYSANDKVILNQKGEIMLSNVYGGLVGDTDLPLYDNIAVVFLRNDDFPVNAIYNIETGEFISKLQYGCSQLQYYKQKAIIPTDNYKYGIIDTITGKFIVHCDYDHIYSFFDDKAIAIKGNEHEIIDTNGNILNKINIDLSKAEIEYACGTNIILKTNNKYYVYNAETGNNTDFYDEIDFYNFDDGMIRGKKDNKYYFINKDFTIISQSDSSFYPLTTIPSSTDEKKVDIINNGVTILKNVDMYSYSINDNGLILVLSRDTKEFIVYDYYGYEIGRHKFDNIPFNEYYIPNIQKDILFIDKNIDDEYLFTDYYSSINEYINNSVVMMMPNGRILNMKELKTNNITNLNINN